MSSSIEIKPTYRPITADDQSLLLRLYIESREGEFAAMGWPPAQLEMFLQMQFNAQKQSYELIYPDAEKSIIQVEGTDVGQLVVNDSKNCLTLVDISVLSGFRNQGIGGIVVRKLQTRAAESKVPLVLHVLRNSDALRLYNRLGFVISNESDIHFEMTWTLRDQAQPD